MVPSAQGKTALELAARTLYVRERGDRTVADPVIPKPLATAMASLTWVYSCQEREPVHSVTLVLLVWTKETSRVPLGTRL
jgi:hypothetical protein